MSFRKSINLSIDGEVAAELEVAFMENENEPDKFTVTVRRENHGPSDAEAIWHVQQTDGNFSLQVTAQNVASGICLAGCLSGIVTGAGPKVDCLKKAKSRKDVRNCINQHGVWQAVGALSCIYGCMHV
ncbi:hypothetical protein [Tateyamaria pelophila]|uniref:hypothetical protein n=1 Tax=Tateyamaria pelophila TaxID=328415 RepID=UPI001CBE30E9|nr:hypothetical protein [Tateyamaria pelophila]